MTEQMRPHVPKWRLLTILIGPPVEIRPKTDGRIANQDAHHQSYPAQADHAASTSGRQRIRLPAASPCAISGAVFAPRLGWKMLTMLVVWLPAKPITNMQRQGPCHMISLPLNGGITVIKFALRIAVGSSQPYFQVCFTIDGRLRFDFPSLPTYY